MSEPDIERNGMLEPFCSAGRTARHSALINRGAESRADFYPTVVLASIVEREAILDEERPMIAGVYQNRINGLDNVRVLNAEPVLIYAKDMMALRDQHISQWPEYVFWTLDGLGSAQDFEVTPDLEGYQVWHSRGLPPGPICTPGLGLAQSRAQRRTLPRVSLLPGQGRWHERHTSSRKTYEEHLHNVDIYSAARCAIRHCLTGVPTARPTEAPARSSARMKPIASRSRALG